MKYIYQDPIAQCQKLMRWNIYRSCCQNWLWLILRDLPAKLRFVKVIFLARKSGRVNLFINLKSAHLQPGGQYAWTKEGDKMERSREKMNGNLGNNLFIVLVIFSLQLSSQAASRNIHSCYIFVTRGSVFLVSLWFVKKFSVANYPNWTDDSIHTISSRLLSQKLPHLV